MHDPMVVAFDVKVPIPRRWSHGRRDDAPRWSVKRRRFTNPEHLGQPINPWWRPCAWEVIFAGKRLVWRTWVTVWHVEPEGRDSGTVCKHWADGHQLHAWRWHVHHWHIQIQPLQRIRGRLFDRCAECGRGGPLPFSGQWDTPGMGWRFWRSRGHIYHDQCHALGSLRRSREIDERTIRHLVAALAVERDATEAEALEWLCSVPTNHDGFPFQSQYRLYGMLGYKRDDNHNLVKADPS